MRSTKGTDRASTAPGLLRGTRRLSVVGALLVAATLLAVGLTLYDERRSAIADYTVATTNLCVALADETYRSVQAVDLVAQDVRAQLEEEGAKIPDAFGAFLQSYRMHDLLVRRLSALPQADAMLLVTADGRLATSTRAWPVPDVDDSDRDFFQYFQLHEDRRGFVSAP